LPAKRRVPRKSPHYPLNGGAGGQTSCQRNGVSPENLPTIHSMEVQEAKPLAGATACPPKISPASIQWRYRRPGLLPGQRGCPPKISPLSTQWRCRRPSLLPGQRGCPPKISLLSINKTKQTKKETARSVQKNIEEKPRHLLYLLYQLNV
jgi:hypothetical protein